MNSTFAPNLADRLGAILAPLLILVAARFRTLGPLTVPLWRHLARAQQRLACLIALLAAGRYRPRLRDQSGRPARPTVPHHFPRHHAWLIRALGSEAAIHAARLQTILADPATANLLATTPAAARILRPLCHMLGLPPLPKPPAPRQAAPPPPHPHGRAPRAKTPRPASRAPTQPPTPKS